MRVLWISVFIFLVIILISLVLYEPAEIPLLQQSRLEASPPTDPFITDEVHDKQVELAALPEDPQQASVSSPEVSESSEDSATLEAAHNFTDTSAEQTNNDVVAATGLSIETATEEVGSRAETNDVGTVVSGSPPKTKPKGLLARSIERKKNQNKLAVIVNLENDQQLTIEEIKAMYMDRITHWEDGSKIMLYNLPLGDSHREKFSRNILNMSALEADEAESQRREHNLAINTVRVKNKNIVVSYVERNPNAIAYVPLSMVREKSHVKVIATLP
ncbi:hypothetical protein [Kaarinaea lacus]